MKTKLWMLGMAVAALTSCTQSEVVDIPECRLIKFDTHVDKASRVAYTIEQAGAKAPTTKDNLYQFWVLGYNNNDLFFNGTDASAKVYWDTQLKGFTYANHKTWDLGHTFNFAAYSNGNQPLVGTDISEETIVNTYDENKVKYELVNEGSKLTITDYTVGEQDLLAAIVAPATPTSDAHIDDVSFTFQHLLSCVKFTIKNNSNEYYLRINDITLNAIKTQTCEYSIAADSTKTIVWNGTGHNGDYTFKSFVPIVNNINGNTPNTNDTTYLAPAQEMNMLCFVIPQNNQSLSTNITVKTYKKLGDNSYNETTTGNQNLSANLKIDTSKLSGHGSWKPGYVYNYSAELTGSAHYIHFTVDNVDDWTNQNAGTIISTSGQNL